MDEQGQEVAAQQGFDAGGAVEVDGGDGLGAFEAVVAAFEVGLVAVGGEDLGRGEPGVVGDQRPAAVGGGSAADGVGAGFPGEPEAGCAGLAEAGLGSGTAAVVGGVAPVVFFCEPDVEELDGVGVGQDCPGGLLGGDSGLDSALRSSQAVG